MLHNLCFNAYMILNYYEVKDLEKIFGVGRTTIYYWVRSGWLSGSKASISNIFSAAEISAFVEKIKDISRMRKYLESWQEHLKAKRSAETDLIQNSL